MISVDASVAAKWVLNEAYAAQAGALYRDTIARGEAIIAPPLLPAEVTNIVRQRVRRQLLTPEQADQVLADFLNIPVTLTSVPSAHAEALQLANQYDLPATYDAYYLVLAQTVGADLWTDDQRLLRLVGGKFSTVHWIAEYVSN